LLRNRCEIVLQSPRDRFAIATASPPIPSVSLRNRCAIAEQSLRGRFAIAL
jgi:hypothetical protein